MNKSKKIIGIATIGKKGQIVIPAEARNLLKLKKGEKLIIMMVHKNSLAIIKSSEFEAIATRFTKNINIVRKMIKK
jgi:AbrB family looped-hinge helix DNA binding protein